MKRENIEIHFEEPTETEELEEEEIVSEKWIFDKEHYSSKLKSDLPVKNFFKWF